MPGKRLVWVDRQGQVRPVTDEPRDYFGPRISPGGQRIAVQIREEGNYDIWTYDIPRAAVTRLTLAESHEEVPVWTPDGERVTFYSTRDGPKHPYWKRADGSGPAERLGESRGWPQSWSPDGRVLAVIRGGDISMLPREREWQAEPFTNTPYNEGSAEFSPDGRWIAYNSNESGQWEVYVRPYPSGTGRWLISVGGGQEPLWAPDGKEIFYRWDDKVMVVPVRLAPEFRAERPRVLFEDRFEDGLPGHVRNYDISADGERFLMLQGEQTGPNEVVVVFNWFEELKRLVPTN